MYDDVRRRTSTYDDVRRRTSTYDDVERKKQCSMLIRFNRMCKAKALMGMRNLFQQDVEETASTQIVALQIVPPFGPIGSLVLSV